MKNKLLKITTIATMIPLLVTSCTNDKNKVFVPINLDYSLIDKVENIFPTILNGDQVRMMIDTDQDFVLYFFSKNCASCKIVSQFFAQFLKNYPYQIYAFSAESSDFTYVHSLHPDLFDATPKIMFFKKGENVLTISSSRYNSYRSFESAMLEFCVKTNIYTTTKLSGFNAFDEYHDNFLIYILDENKIKDGDSPYPTYDYYQKNVYPILSKSNTPSLLISSLFTDQELKKTIYSKYGLTEDVNSWAIYIDEVNQTYTRYNYLKPDDSKLLLECLDVNF